MQKYQPTEKSLKIKKIRTLLMFATAKKNYHEIDRLKYLLRQAKKAD